MTEHKPYSSGRDCPPQAEHPADQAPEPKKCEPPPTTTPPEVKRPNDCEPPDPDCNCPPKPGNTTTCFDELLSKQESDISTGERAKAFKTLLDGVQKKANDAVILYTRDKYDALVKQWAEQDDLIADLIRRLVCAVPCWRCIIECHVCPILNDLHNDEKWLNGEGDGTLPEKANNLYDLRYWCQRDRDIKDARVKRIQSVLTAWDKPAAALDAVLTDIKGQIAAGNKALGTEPGKVVFDVFMRLVPLHLAIAPLASVAKTKIDEKYTCLCECDKGWPDACCGPDVGPQSLRQRLLKPQPYLLDPSKYRDLICCLVKERLAPATDALSKAQGALATVEAQIKNINDKLAAKLATFAAFENEAKAAIPSDIKCCDAQLPGTDSKSSTAR